MMLGGSYLPHVLSKLSNLPAVFPWPAYIGWLLVSYQHDDSHSVEEDE